MEAMFNSAITTKNQETAQGVLWGFTKEELLENDTTHRVKAVAFKKSSTGNWNAVYSTYDHCLMLCLSMMPCAITLATKWIEACIEACIEAADLYGLRKAKDYRFVLFIDTHETWYIQPDKFSWETAPDPDSDRIEQIKAKVAASGDTLEGLMDLTDTERALLYVEGVLTASAETITGGGLWQSVGEIELFPDEIYDMLYAADQDEDYTPEAVKSLALIHDGTSGEWRTILTYDGEELEPVEASTFPWEDDGYDADGLWA